MDTLRATNLSSILTTTNHQDNNKNKGMMMMKLIDKDNVSKLVSVFGELSKHEKILFLINIREFTSSGGSDGGKGVCNGGGAAVTTTPKQEEIIKIEKEQEDPPPPPSSSPLTTPQSLRLSRTSNWLQKTFIQDSQVALPKEEVYSLYKHEFVRLNEKPISTADFGKLMRQVFPDVKARRLGQRGQSKYCYANIRKRSDVEKPALPNPLPQNELVCWAKNKFNIDFGEVGQVVAFLKCEERGSSGGSGGTRKRRASCGGSLLKNGRGGSKGAGAGPSVARSASVSVLELSDSNRDDPLMLLHDNESLEIGSYFENSNNSSNWPQLRSLLTDESNSSNGSFGNNSFSGISGKKKRHSSSVQFEFIKPEGGIGLLHRSQSVPVTEMSFIRGGGTLVGLDEMTGAGMFDEFGSSSGGGGGGEINSNPLFSSAVTGGGIVLGESNGGSGSNKSGGGSNCSSSSSVMFESIGGSSNVGDGGGGGGSSNVGIEVSIGGNELIDSGRGLLSNGIISNGLVLGGGGGGGGNVSGGVVGDVFFDSVFDLMMSDCQN